MKKTLSMIALAVLTIGLLGSCSKINERLDNLDKRVDGLENEKIASIESQITGINSSISDLGTIRSNIQSLTDEAKSQGQNIADLQAADKALGERIADLNKYVNDTLKGTTDWVKGTFSTLEQYEKTCDTIAKIDARIGALDENLSKKIDDCAASIKEWVNELFKGYYTTAQMDAKISALQRQIDTTRGISDERADSIIVDLAATKVSIDTAKSAIRAEYKVAVQQAIEDNEGFVTATIKNAIDSVHGRVDSLTAKVDAIEADVKGIKEDIEGLKAMIQSIVFVPEREDGQAVVNYFGAIDTAHQFTDLVMQYRIRPATALDTIFSLKSPSRFFSLYYTDVIKTKALTGRSNLPIKRVARISDNSDIIVLMVDGNEFNKLSVRNGISDHSTLSVALGVGFKNTGTDVMSEYTDISFEKLNFEADLENVYKQMALLIGSRQQGKDYNPYRVLFNMCGDDVIAAGRRPGDHDEIAALNQFRYDASNEVIYYCYTNFYKAIDVCNQFIFKYFKDSDSYELKDRSLPVEEMESALAQVRTLRAWLHFTLATGWGNPPIVTKWPAPAKPTNSDGQQSVFKWCIEELDKTSGSGKLPERYYQEDKENVCYVTKHFALALQGKIALFLGDRGLAGKCLKEVIESGKYALYPSFDGEPTARNYAYIFHTEGNGNSESIFELDMEKYAGPGYWDIQNYLPYMGMEKGLWNWYSDGFVADPLARLSPVKGSGLLGISESFAREVLDYPAFIGYTDKRDAYFPRVSKRAEGGIFWPDGYESSKIRKMTPAQLEESNLVGIKNNGLYGQWFYLPYKQLVLNGDVNMATGNRNTNFTIMRYAEVLLLLSETTEEPQYLNMIQARSGAPQTTYNLKDLQREKEYELWMEGCRWVDLVRWSKEGKVKLTDLLGKAGQNIPVLYDKKTRTPMPTESPEWENGDESNSRFYILHTTCGKESGFKEKKHEYFPYPQAVIRSNPNLRQNPGWEK